MIKKKGISDQITIIFLSWVIALLLLSTCKLFFLSILTFNIFKVLYSLIHRDVMSLFCNRRSAHFLSHLLKEERSEWSLSNLRSVSKIADKASDIVEGLFRLAERCFDLLNEQTKPLVDGQHFLASQVYGATLSSPLTLLRIIHQIQPVVKGGG